MFRYALRCGAVMIAGLAVACGAENANPGNDAGAKDAPPGDAYNPCRVEVSFTPSQAQAGTGTARARAQAYNADGVIDYRWQVTANGMTVPTTKAQPDGSEVSFSIDQPGVYQALVQLDSGSFCPSGNGFLNVAATNANSATYRLRFTAPPEADIPVQDRVMMVGGGADYFAGPLVLERGVTGLATILSGGLPVPAFVRITSTGSSAPIAVETYSNAAGAITLPLQFGMYDVLISPSATTLAPLRLSWDTLATTLDVPTGTAVTGHVFGPSGAPLANARVALRVGNVPSSVGTTDSNGQFVVQARPTTGATTELRVAPSNGLPTLVASGQFDLSANVVVNYAASLAVRNLQGVEVRDANNAALPFTQVAVRGEIANGGTVIAGPTVIARGVTTASTTTDAGGKLLALPVPTIALTAAIAPPSGPSGTVAVPVATPASVRADAPAAMTATIKLAGTPLAGVELRLTPVTTSPLAALPPLQLTATTNAAGLASINVAAGARFDVRIVDPLRRIAPMERLDVAVGALGTLAATKALTILGTTLQPGSTSPLANVGVQVFCVQCPVAQQQIPLAQGVSDRAGVYAISVADPGTH